MSASAKIQDLQVLRGISIILVLLQHIFITPYLFSIIPKKVEMPFYLGVDIFFVISGYVICLSLKKDLFHPGSFLIKRFFRLFPALLIFVLVSIFANNFFLLVEKNGLPDFKINSGPKYVWEQISILTGTFVLFLQFSSSYCYTNGAMWTLSIEDMFYTLVAFLCFASYRISLKKNNFTKIHLAGWLAITYATLVVSRLCLLFNPVFFNSIPGFLKWLVGIRFDFLLIGILMGLLEDFGFWKKRVEAFSNCYGNFLTPFCLIVPMVLCALSESSFEKHPRMLHGFTFLVANPAFAVLVLLCSRNASFPEKNSFIYKLFSLIGDRSYTIYLFHYPAMLIAWTLACFLTKQKLMPFEFRTLSPIVYGCFQIFSAGILLIPFVELIYRKVEIPLANYGKKLAVKILESSDIKKRKDSNHSDITLKKAA